MEVNYVAVNSDGFITAEVDNQAVSLSLLKILYPFQTQNRLGSAPDLRSPG